MTVIACAGRVYGVRQASARTPYTPKREGDRHEQNQKQDQKQNWPYGL